jgi:hypothetical protein
MVVAWAAAEQPSSAAAIASLTTLISYPLFRFVLRPKRLNAQ